MDRGSAQRHASAGCGGRAAWVVVSGGGLDAGEADGSCPVAPERRGRGRRREDGDADGGRWRRGRGRSREKRWRDAAAVFAGGDSRARPGRLLPRTRSGPGKMVALARQWNDRTTVAPPDCFTECFHKMIPDSPEKWLFHLAGVESSCGKQKLSTATTWRPTSRASSGSPTAGDSGVKLLRHAMRICSRACVACIFFSAFTILM